MQGSLAMSGGWANITGSTVGWPRMPPSQAWQGLDDSAVPAISGTGLGQTAPVFPLSSPLPEAGGMGRPNQAVHSNAVL